MMHHRSTLGMYAIALVALVDQLSKYWVIDMMKPPRVIPMAPFLNFVLVHNKGVTFGMLNQLNESLMPYFLVGVAAVVLFLLGRWLWLTTSTWVAIGLGLIMGGAVGNVIDRLRFGAVVDFLDFYYRDYHWYAFNAADAAIVTGVALLFLDSLVRAR